MSDFGYVNARLRALRSKRLRAADFEAALGIDEIGALGDWMSSGPYAAALGKASETAEGLKAVDGAISERLRETLASCVKMVSTDPDSTLRVYLARNDFENVKVVARTVINGTGYAGARAALVPLAPLDAGALERLCECENLGDVARALMTWGHPAGRVLGRFLRDSQDPPALDELDRALERGYLAYALESVDEEVADEEAELLQEALRDEVDQANLRTAMKVAYAGGGSLPADPLPHGRLKRAYLERIAACRSLPETLDLVGKTVFRKAVDGAAAAAAQAGDLGGLERCLERARLARLARGGVLDPTGFGFTLRFLAETRLEAQNLRLIARAAAGLIPPDTVQEAMIYV